MAKRLFLFLAISNRGIGGSYIYMDNKLRYYAKQGWETLLIHSNNGDNNGLVIPGLSRYNENHDIHMRLMPSCFTLNTRKIVLASIIEKFSLRNYDEILIESNELHIALWGELLAKELNARNFVFLLSENNRINSKSMFDFLEFKVSRHELAGITSDSIPQLFTGWEIKQNLNNLNLLAYCFNCIDDIENPYFIPDVDYVVSIIGRVRKPFIYKAIDDVVKYIDNNLSKSFFLLIIGGYNDKDHFFHQYVEKRFKSTRNASWLITGPIYPIPLSLLKCPDVFISSAGSSRVPAKLGKLSISYDANDLKPIGIVGVTTRHELFRGEDEPALELSELLDDILVHKKYHEFETNFDVEKENDVDFSSHDQFLDESSHEKRYFDVDGFSMTIKERFRSLPVKFFGVKKGTAFLESYSRFRQKI